jgi:hypothetical protein
MQRHVMLCLQDAEELFTEHKNVSPPLDVLFKKEKKMLHLQ